MEEMSVHELQSQRPTRGIERHSHDYLDTDFQVWDLGGQLNYRETYLSKPEVFNQTKAMIFVCDIQDTNRIEEAYEYYVDILNILVNVDPLPKLYVLFHKFDPELAGQLKAHFYRATRLFRKADKVTRHKFKGYATSIYANTIDLAVKRILFENFEDYKEPTARLRAKPKGKITEEEATVPTPSAAPATETAVSSATPLTETPAPSAAPITETVTPSPVTASATPTSTPAPVTEPVVETSLTESEETLATEVVEEEPDEVTIDQALEEATPTDLMDLSEDVVNKLTAIINTRMKESEEIVALSILSTTGEQSLAIGKTEMDYDRLSTLKEVVSTMNPKQFFKDLTDIEYRGLGHFSLADFDIYFARASDEYAIAVLATDVSTAMLQNAQRIVRSIRQGLGMVPDTDEEEEEKMDKEKPKGKKDLVADLRNRLKALSGLDEI